MNFLLEILMNMAPMILNTYIVLQGLFETLFLENSIDTFENIVRVTSEESR